jgi:hypothetical protein
MSFSTLRVAPICFLVQTISSGVSAPSGIVIDPK